MSLKNLTPHEIADLLKRDMIVLIDVREPDEYAAGHIKGAHLVPLSAFNPHSLPRNGGRSIVLHCRSGGRSAKAVALCQRAGVSVDSHMQGGILGWQAAGLPVER
jgi:rhodanese-related sulfurtransferase